ncbi:MAG: hypothetical protein ACI97A_003741 [Planctomycetota bacterium]|jgi:hypothetical protein
MAAEEDDVRKLMTRVCIFVMMLCCGLSFEVKVHGQSTEEQEVLDKKSIRAATNLAVNLAKAGYKRECRAIFGELERWGEKRDVVKKTKAKSDASFAKVKKKKSSKSLSKAAVKLAASLMKKSEAFAEDEKQFRASVALFFDSTNETANGVLGRSLIDGEWSTKMRQSALARRAEFADAIRRVRALEIKVEVSPSMHEVLIAHAGTNGVLIEAHGMAVHTNIDEHQAVRMVKEALRALALSNFVLHGKLAVPKFFRNEWVYFDSIAPYLAAAKACIDRKGMDEEYGKIALTSQGYFRKDRVGVFYNVSENMISGALFKFAKENSEDFRGTIPMLKVGHLHWISRSYLGVPLAGMIWLEQSLGDVAPKEYDREFDKAEKKKRALLFRMSEAGILGSLAYVKYLEEQGDLPPTSDLLVREMGMLNGINLLKAIHLVEYLQERGDAQEVFEDSGTAVLAEQESKLVAVLGRLTDFDEEWATWLRGNKPGIAQLLGSAKDEWKPSSDAQDLIAYLNKLRVSSQKFEPEYDWPKAELVRSISTGCQLHAVYLGFNPKQVQTWPGAHEEYSDKKGFSPKGCWAGLNSVIMPGVKSGREAIDVWMGTFYHRTPLLEPGLIGIGYGLFKNVAVMDTGSLLNNAQEARCIVWPYPGMKNVPQRFNPELPNPVKGEDQSTWGYPVTIQVLDDQARAPRSGTMTLHLGGTKGTVIPCHYSTPAKPTNPDAAPAGCFCLMPKAHLKSGQKYTVVAAIQGEKKRVWSFTTAR